MIRLGFVACKLARESLVTLYIHHGYSWTSGGIARNHILVYTCAASNCMCFKQVKPNGHQVTTLGFGGVCEIGDIQREVMFQFASNYVSSNVDHNSP